LFGFPVKNTVIVVTFSSAADELRATAQSFVRSLRTIRGMALE
jgi:hypothetical protein